MSSELSLRPGIFGGKKLRANNDHLRAKDPQNSWRKFLDGGLIGVITCSPKVGQLTFTGSSTCN
jgi:hypothetical protein